MFSNSNEWGPLFSNGRIPAAKWIRAFICLFVPSLVGNFIVGAHSLVISFIAVICHLGTLEPKFHSLCFSSVEKRNRNNKQGTDVLARALWVWCTNTMVLCSSATRVLFTANWYILYGSLASLNRARPQSLWCLQYPPLGTIWALLGVKIKKISEKKRRNSSHSFHISIGKLFGVVH